MKSSLLKKSLTPLHLLGRAITNLLSKRDLVVIIFFTILGIGGVFAATLITVTAPDSQGAGYVAATSCDEAVTINSPSNFSSTSKTFVVDTITVSGVDNNNLSLIHISEPTRPY